MQRMPHLGTSYTSAKNLEMGTKATAVGQTTGPAQLDNKSTGIEHSGTRQLKGVLGGIDSLCRSYICEVRPYMREEWV